MDVCAGWCNNMLPPMGGPVTWSSSPNQLSTWTVSRVSPLGSPNPSRSHTHTLSRSLFSYITTTYVPMTSTKPSSSSSSSSSSTSSTSTSTSKKKLYADVIFPEAQKQLGENPLLTGNLRGFFVAHVKKRGKPAADWYAHGGWVCVS